MQRPHPELPSSATAGKLLRDVYVRPVAVGPCKIKSVSKGFEIEAA
jgi:hypothetical protein